MKILDPNVFWTMVTTAQPKILNTEYVFFLPSFVVRSKRYKTTEIHRWLLCCLYIKQSEISEQGISFGNTSVIPQKRNQN